MGLLEMMMNGKGAKVWEDMTGRAFSQGSQIAIVCTPSEKRCVDSVIEECNSEGSGWDVLEVCEFGCDSGALVCNEEITQTCMPGEIRCLGNESQVCNPEGTGWEIVGHSPTP